LKLHYGVQAGNMIRGSWGQVVEGS